MYSSLSFSLPLLSNHKELSKSNTTYTTQRSHFYSIHPVVMPFLIRNISYRTSGLGTARPENEHTRLIITFWLLIKVCRITSIFLWFLTFTLRSISPSYVLYLVNRLPRHINITCSGLAYLHQSSLLFLKAEVTLKVVVVAVFYLNSSNVCVLQLHSNWLNLSI